MADEQKDLQNADQGKKSSPLLMNLIIMAVVILVPAILGLVTFMFVLRPALNQGGEEEEVSTEVVDTIPATVVVIDFEEAQASVNVGPDVTPPILIYKVAMACANQETSDMITARMSYFTSMIGKLHRNRTEAELSDPIIQESILKQARQEANRLLKKFAPDGSMEVIQAMHVKYAIFTI